METAAGSSAGSSLTAWVKAANASSVLPSWKRARPSRWRTRPFLGSSSSQCVQPLLGRLPIFAGLCHRGQARERLAAKDLCFLGVPPAGADE